MFGGTGLSNLQTTLGAYPKLSLIYAPLCRAGLKTIDLDLTFVIKFVEDMLDELEIGGVVHPDEYILGQCYKTFFLHY